MQLCPFCLEQNILKGEILAENTEVYAVSSTDKNLNKAGMIITKRHVSTPFDMTESEWQNVFQILQETRRAFEKHYQPDGFMIGWNVGSIAGQNVDHAHLHLICRFANEPLAGKGLRYLFKQDENKTN